MLKTSKILSGLQYSSCALWLLAEPILASLCVAEGDTECIDLCKTTGWLALALTSLAITVSLLLR